MFLPSRRRDITAKSSSLSVSLQHILGVLFLTLNCAVCTFLCDADIPIWDKGIGFLTVEDSVLIVALVFVEGALGNILEDDGQHFPVFFVLVGRLSAPPSHFSRLSRRRLGGGFSFSSSESLIIDHGCCCYGDHPASRLVDRAHFF